MDFDTQLSINIQICADAVEHNPQNNEGAPFVHTRSYAAA